MEPTLLLYREYYALQGKTIAQQLLASICNIPPHQSAFVSGWPVHLLLARVFCELSAPSNFPPIPLLLYQGGFSKSYLLQYCWRRFYFNCSSSQLRCRQPYPVNASHTRKYQSSFHAVFILPFLMS